jgi:transcriptional regulator GlxA family with amidase domain
VTHVAFLLAPQVHLLDLAGPAQVFAEAADFGYPYTLSYVADQEDVPSAQGLSLKAATEWPALTANDIVIVPGWKGEAPLNVKKLAAHHAQGGMVASICSGADALGRAGLLDGRRCTTHHQLQDELARRYPRARLIKDVLYTVDGRVVTSAGVASGIDLALHLVAAEHGPAAAARVAREMVVYARRNGDEPQASVMLRHRAHLSDVVHRVQDLIDNRYTDRLPLADLATASQVSERTLTRLFAASTGVTPLRYQQLLRVERAEHLIGHGSTIEAAARAVGVEDARMLKPA